MVHTTEDNFLGVNVDTTTSTEPLDTGNVEDTLKVAVPKPKKSKHASSRGVTKRGSLVDDDTFKPPKLSMDNDGSDNVEDMPQEPRDSATNVTSDAAVSSVLLDEQFDNDDISVQPVQDNELEPPTSTSDPAQRQLEDMDFIYRTEPPKRRRLDMGDLMVRTNVTKRAGLSKPLSQFKAPKRPEITRLPPYDNTETCPQRHWARVSVKDGRLFVADLIRLRENESKLVQELVNE